MHTTGSPTDLLAVFFPVYLVPLLVTVRRTVRCVYPVLNPHHAKLYIAAMNSFTQKGTFSTRDAMEHKKVFGAKLPLGVTIVLTSYFLAVSFEIFREVQVKSALIQRLDLVISY